MIQTTTVYFLRLFARKLETCNKIKEYLSDLVPNHFNSATSISEVYTKPFRSI